MKRATIFSGLVDVDKNLVGTAVIYRQIADILIQKGYKVTIVVPRLPDIEEAKIKFVLYSEKSNIAEINQSSLIIFGAYPPISPMLYAHKKKKVIMTYLWSVAPIGSLEFKDFSSKTKQINLHEYITASYNLSLLLSDKIFCRDKNIARLIIGSLISVGRINLDNYKADQSFKRLIEAAPFGVNAAKPVKKRIIYRGVVKGINKDDFILLWNGGIWNWNDGVTLVRAMQLLKGSNIKLIFQGFKHPKKGVRISKAAKQCFDLAVKFKLNNKSIFFIDTWVPYTDRADFLLESDVGVVSSPDIPEANMFYKTRIYDNFWAGLPTILNSCEAFAPIIEHHGLGLVATAGDAQCWADKIISLRNNQRLVKQIKTNIKAYCQGITWQETLSPIADFVSLPVKAEDAGKTRRLVADSIKMNGKIISAGL